MQHRFLIIQTAFIGDVVLATAVAEKLHQYYPTAPIDFLLRKGNESLLHNHPFLHKVWVWNKQEHKLRNLWRMARSIRKQRYTHVINLHRFASSGFITAMSGAKEKSGFDKNPLSFFFTQQFPHSISKPGDENPTHETTRNQSLIASLTDATPARPRLYPTPADEQAAAPYNTGAYYCISPASVWFTKQYPPQQWAALIDALPKDATIYLLGGKGDTPLAEEIMALAQRKANIQSLCGKLGFLQSAALMRTAVMNYVNDSGPLHFCSAVNAPVTAVFCSTVPEFGFGPLSTHSRVVEVKNLYCKPCGLHGHRQCPEGHFRCAIDIPTEALLP